MADLEIASAFNKTAYLINNINTVKNTGKAQPQHQRRCLCNKHLTNNTNNECATATTKTNNYNKNCTRPLTLCLVVMMVCIILIPQNIEAAAMRKHLFDDVASVDTSLQTSADVERLLLESSSSSSDYVDEEHIDAAINEISSDSSLDSLSPLEVLKHMERMEEHQKHGKTNLRKRQASHLTNLRYFDGSSHHTVWHNPCNVAQVVNSASASQIPRRAYLQKFLSDVRKEFLTRRLSLTHIDIGNMDMWRYHRDFYSFLPKLKQNSSISLSRWYRDMQIFVASFAYLGRTQYTWDLTKQQYVAETTKELDQLLTSARLILCELETTINGSHPNKNVKMLKSLSHDEMDAILTFKTKEDPKSGAHSIDLRFSKNSYFKYLASLRKVLKGKMQRKDQSLRIDSAENSAAKSGNNAGDESSINLSSLMRSDSSMSLGESFEMIMKSSQTPEQNKVKRTRKPGGNKRKSAELPQM